MGTKPAGWKNSSLLLVLALTSCGVVTFLGETHREERREGDAVTATPETGAPEEDTLCLVARALAESGEADAIADLCPEEETTTAAEDPPENTQDPGGEPETDEGGAAPDSDYAGEDPPVDFTDPESGGQNDGNQNQNEPVQSGSSS